METPEAPREGTAAKLVQAAETRGFSAATWAGRGDQQRGISRLALLLAAAYFVALFLPWIGFGGHQESGWFVAQNPGIVALAVVLVESLRLAGAWISRGSHLLAFCLAAATGALGVESLVNFRWGGAFPGNGFSIFQYGAWIGLALAVLLVVVAALRLAMVRRSVP